MVNKIADVISETRTSIRSFNYNIDEGLFEGLLNIMVPNNNALQVLIKRIQKIKGILKASRTNS
jgi:(p)ppGpp synthase/HD superfamily hydrolase